MKKLNFIDKLVYLLNTIAVLILLFSFLLPYISPKTVPLFAILSLFVPFLILINVAFVLYWIIKLKKQFILSTLVLVLGWYLNAAIVKLVGKEDVKENGLSIMSYNVRMFNHWKWINDENISEKIFGFISNKNPDVIVFQEYHTFEENSLNYKYNYIKSKKNSNITALAIFSKYPIINKGSLELEKTANNIIFTDIIKNKDTIRIYNLHLQSLELNTEKENFGQENSEKLVFRLKERFTMQAAQTEVFLQHQKKWNGKIIIAGDFNNTSYSWVYNQIANDKKDAFLEAGKGFGKTFNYWFPMRIDFILTDENATINSFHTYQEEKNSDHFPILANISF